MSSHRALPALGLALVVGVTLPACGHGAGSPPASNAAGADAAAPSSPVKPPATEHYRVEWIRITTPEDVSVIDPTPGPAVTLVGCYPFYHVGPAPKRFIVRAVPAA